MGAVGRRQEPTSDRVTALGETSIRSSAGGRPTSVRGMSESESEEQQCDSGALVSPSHARCIDAAQVLGKGVSGILGHVFSRHSDIEHLVSKYGGLAGHRSGRRIKGEFALFEGHCRSCRGSGPLTSRSRRSNNITTQPQEGPVSCPMDHAAPRHKVRLAFDADPRSVQWVSWYDYPSRHIGCNRFLTVG